MIRRRWHSQHFSLEFEQHLHKLKKQNQKTHTKRYCLSTKKLNRAKPTLLHHSSTPRFRWVFLSEGKKRCQEGVCCSTPEKNKKSFITIDFSLLPKNINHQRRRDHFQYSIHTKKKKKRREKYWKIIVISHKD